MYRLFAIVPLLMALGGLYLFGSLRNENHAWLEDEDEE